MEISINVNRLGDFFQLLVKTYLVSFDKPLDYIVKNNTFMFASVLLLMPFVTVASYKTTFETN